MFYVIVFEILQDFTSIPSEISSGDLRFKLSINLHFEMLTS